MTLARLALVVLMGGCAPLAAADLGRMFFTPQERTALDEMREKRMRSTARGDEPAAPAPQNVSVNGLVRGSDGRNTVWLNNRATAERRADPISVTTNDNDSRVRITVQESGRTIDLKVGQSAEIVSGTITEGYARRAAIGPETKPDSDKSASGRARTAAAESLRSERATPRNSARAREENSGPLHEAPRDSDEYAK